MSKSLARDPAGAAAVHLAKAELDQAEGAVVRAQRSLARLREAHGRTIGTAIARHREAAAAAVAGAAGILAQAEAAAAREHAELPDVVTYSAAILGVITAAHRSAARQRNGSDREFSKAAAAMAARAALPQPAAPTKWTGKLSDIAGDRIVDDGLIPIPIKPGSSHTTQRIPAAIANGAVRAPAEPFRLSAAAVTATARLLRKK